MSVIGGKALKKKLHRLGQVAQGKVIRQATGFAMTSVLKRARETAPQGSEQHTISGGRVVAPGFLSRNIRKVSYKKTDQTGALVIGTRVGFTKAAFYGRFLELGTKFQKARPFLEKALTDQRNQVVSRYAQKLRKALIKEARRK